MVAGPPLVALSEEALREREEELEENFNSLGRRSFLAHNIPRNGGGRSQRGERMVCWALGSRMRRVGAQGAGWTRLLVELVRDTMLRR
jgi:hypothetical protein